MGQLFVSAVLAGACIGLGSMVSACAPHPYLGALFFSIGLLYVRIRGFALLTGQNQYLLRGVTPQNWLIVLAGNALGVAVMAIMASLGGMLGMAQTAELSITAAAKFAAAPQSYLFPAIFCGCLMTVATHPNAQHWVSSLCVVTFILCGFRHCIADVFWLVLTPLNLNTLLSWVVIIAGNLIGGWLIGWGMRKAESK